MKSRALCLLIALAGLCGCVQSHYNLATDEQNYTLTSDTREVSIGRKIARKVEEECPPVADIELQEKVNTIGQQLAAVSSRKELLYRFAVIEGDTVNAFSLPGGYVFLYDGLVKKTKSDSELASVLAHEIAHIAARHSIQRAESSMGAQLLQLASLATKQPAAAGGVGIALQATLLSHAREDELQADRLAVQYLKAAGFEAQGMLTFLYTMQEIHRQEANFLPRGVVNPNYAYTHPGIPERIAGAKEALYGVADYIDYLNVPQ